MSWQAGIRGPAFVGEAVGFEIRPAPAAQDAAGAHSTLIVEARLSEEAAGLLLAAAEWASSEFGGHVRGTREAIDLESARLVLERGLVDYDDGLVEVRLGLGQVAIVAGAATLCAQMGGLDPYLVSEMTAGARSLQAAAAMAPVAREMGLGCRDRMSAAPFSVN